MPWVPAGWLNQNQAYGMLLTTGESRMGLQTAPIWYLAVSCFDEAEGQKWQDYVRWAGLAHLRELITLDPSLCRRVVSELSDEDWLHNVHEDNMQEFFLDLDYLLARTSQFRRIHIFAVQREPSKENRSFLAESDFAFVGYDILDREGAFSLLTNCGPFPLACDKTELSEVGLVVDFYRAEQVRRKLFQYYSANEHVPECVIWAVWKMLSPSLG